MLRSLVLTAACLLTAICTAAQSSDASQPITRENAAEVTLMEILGRGVINELAWSPDSAQLAVASSIGLYLHDGNDLDAEPLLVDVPSGARSVAYSPDGTRMATGSENGTVTIWDSASHEAIFTLQEHLYPVTDINWSPDGRWLVSGDESGIARVWDAGTGEGVQVLEGSGSINSAAFSADGARLLVGGVTAVLVWNTATWETEVEIDGASDARWFPDGQRILTVDTGDGPFNVNIWDAQTGNKLLILPQERDPLSVEISADGQWVATGSLLGTWLWDAATGVGEEQTNNSGPATFTPDGTALTYGVYPLQIVDLETREVRREISFTADSALSFSPDGRRVASIIFGRLRLIDVEAEEATGTTFDYHSPIASLASSANGSLLGGEASGNVCIYYFNDPERTQYCGGAGIYDYWRASIQHVTFLPNADDAFAWGAPNGYVGLESIAESESPNVFQAHDASVSGILYLQGGERFISASEDGSIRIYQAETDSEIARYDAPAPLESLALKPDSNVFAAGDSLNHIEVWALGSKRPHMILEGHSAAVRALTFSADGARLASGGDDGVIMVWDTDSWEPLATLHGHMRGITSLAYNADGSVLASGSLDNTIRLWDVDSGELLATLEGHTGGVTGVTFLPDGRLASASYDGTFRFWGLDGA